MEGELPAAAGSIIPGHQIVGTVERSDREDFAKGQRVGIAWLNRTCGRCRFCLSGRENLCEFAEIYRWTTRGRLDQYVRFRQILLTFCLIGFDDINATPLLCAIRVQNIEIDRLARLERHAAWDLRLRGSRSCVHPDRPLPRH